MPGFAVLRVQNIAHPLPHKGLCIQIQQDGTGRNLSVARVAQSFPMRAVQRHAAVLIGAQAHDRRVMKPVEKIVAAEKAAADRMIGGYQHRGQVSAKAGSRQPCAVELQRNQPPLSPKRRLRIPVAMPAKARMDLLLLLACQHKHIPLNLPVAASAVVIHFPCVPIRRYFLREA